MNSRLFRALLRLLPLSVSQSSDNPIQLQRLPDHSRAEFDYPVFQDTPAAARHQTLVLIFVAALLAPILSWANTLSIYPARVINGGLSTLALMIGTALVILGAMGARWPLAGYVVAALSLPIVAEFVMHESFLTASAVPALIGTWILAERMGTLFLFLKTAAPVPRQRSLEARALWARRWLSPIRSLRGTECHPLNFLLFAVPVMLAVLQERGTWLLDSEALRVLELFGVLAVTSLLWPLALELLLAPIYGRRPYGPLRLLRAFWHALTEWCTYNRLNTQGVGIHRSPTGHCFGRRWLLIGVILLWACAWNNPQGVKPMFSRMLDALLQAQGLMPAINRLDFDKIHEDVRTKNEAEKSAALPPLTDAEQRMLARMSPLRAEAYKQERERQHAEDWERRRKQESTSQLTRSSANHLSHLLNRFGRIALLTVVPILGTALICLSLVFGASARALAGIEDLFGDKARERILNSENWEMLVQRLRASEDSWEQKSLFMGTNWRDDTPVLVPREVFAEHAHILGDSGSGKTSVALMPLISQLMRGGECSVVVLDLKADDQALFETLKVEATALDNAARKKEPDGPGYRFRWFTSATHRSSYIFNPLTQRAMSRLADHQRTDILATALGLNYGTDYGRKFFTDANFDLLNFVLAQNPNVQSFAELADILVSARLPIGTEIAKAASNVKTSIRRQSRCEPLNGSRYSNTPCEALEQAIDFADVVSVPQAVYFALPPASGVTNTAEIARLALYSLMAAAQLHVGERKPVFLVVDEFQRIVSNNLGLFLQMARSMDIGVILSNQSLDDLELADANLIPAVRTNTRFRQVFAAGNRADIMDIRDTAGETTVGLRSWDLLPGLFSEGAIDKVNVRETITPRLMLNDILLATDAFGRNIVTIRRGAGYAQYGGMSFIMDSVHHITHKQFEGRRDEKWPVAVAGTITATNQPPSKISEGGGVIDDELPPISDLLPPQKFPVINEPKPDSPSKVDQDLRAGYEKQRREHSERAKKRKKPPQQQKPSQPGKGQILDDKPPVISNSANTQSADVPEPNPDSADGLDDELMAHWEEQQRKDSERRKRKKRSEQDQSSQRPFGDLFS